MTLPRQRADRNRRGRLQRRKKLVLDPHRTLVHAAHEPGLPTVGARDAGRGGADADAGSRTVTTPKPAPPISPALAAAQALASKGPSTVAGALGLPSAKQCHSRRAFYVRLKEPKDIEIAKVKMTFRGKKLVIRRVSGRRTAFVDMRGLTKGTFVLSIDVTTTTGVKLHGQRKYKTCSGTKKSSKL